MSIRVGLRHMGRSAMFVPEVPVTDPNELDVYKYLAAKLDPSIMNIRLIGAGSWVPTEDIVIYGFYLTSVGVGATREIASHGISYLPFGGVRVKTGDTITGIDATSAIIYANVSDMVYANAKEKYYERLENLLALGRGDLTEIGLDSAVAGTVYTTTFTTGANGTIVLYGFLSGFCWAYIRQTAPNARFYPSIAPESVKSNGTIDYNDLLGTYAPFLSLPASIGMTFGGMSETRASPAGHISAQIWVYDIPADW